MMNFLYLLKKIVLKEKLALLFLIKLLILGCLLKCIFFFYNYTIANGWELTDFFNNSLIVKWALLYDVLFIAIINLPFLFIVMLAGGYRQHKLVTIPIALTFSAINTLSIFLNSFDIFYYRFHLQRADADLLYVLKNPFASGSTTWLILMIVIIVFTVFFLWYFYKQLSNIIKAPPANNHSFFTNSLLIIFISLFFLTGTKKILPTYPLTEISAVQLPLTQNSFHNFIYSLFRRNETMIPDKNFMPVKMQKSLFSIRKKNTNITAPKNVVLFIMESVPLDFFDKNSPYKVKMPFLDSIVNNSTFFNNAYSYAYSSNKGITAILAGIPTITDIPLYHSNFTSIQRSYVGSILAKKQYSSSFFIGDNYDDFGFAKCCNWLGIQQYYCMKDIPGYQQMEKHSMGLHDEYTLHFMQQQLAKMKQPFLAVHYNISTHYPNDIPSTFNNKYPLENNSAIMKTMQYYNDCLQTFFTEAASQEWFKNTVFIFCSDHWAQPDVQNRRIEEVQSFKIPLFIYDPERPVKTIVQKPVSQLDILNTILYYGGIKDSLLSYGVNLKDSVLQQNRVVFTKTNSAIYQAINDTYVLGFNAMEGKPIYYYAYKNELDKKNNLLLQHNFSDKDSLILKMKAFLQTASNHYRMDVSGY